MLIIPLTFQLVQWQCRELSLARFLLLFVLPCCCCIPLGLVRLFCDYFVFFLFRRLFFRFLGLFSPLASSFCFLPLANWYIYIGEFSHCGEKNLWNFLLLSGNFIKKLAKLWNHSPKIRNHKIEKEKKSYCGLWVKDFFPLGSVIEVAQCFFISFPLLLLWILSVCFFYPLFLLLLLLLFYFFSPFMKAYCGQAQ